MHLYGANSHEHDSVLRRSVIQVIIITTVKHTGRLQRLNNIRVLSSFRPTGLNNTNLLLKEPFITAQQHKKAELSSYSSVEAELSYLLFQEAPIRIRT